MKRHQQHWGEFNNCDFQDEATKAKRIEEDQQIMLEKDEHGELKILLTDLIFEEKLQMKKIKSKDEKLNQIVSFRRKKDILQEIIDMSKEDQYNFQHLLPIIRDSLNLLPTEIPIQRQSRHNPLLNKMSITSQSSFTAGKPKDIKKINKTCVRLALRKSICGLASLHFHDANQSAINMLTDSVEHFYKSLMESIVTVLTNEDRDTATDIDVLTFEKAYFALTGESSTSFFNYFKTQSIKHAETVTIFNDKLSELRNIVVSAQSSNVPQNNFYLKQEIKNEMEDYE